MECAVCHIPMQAGEESVIEPPNKKSKLDIHKVGICVTPCGHMFHTACLIKCLRQEGRQLRSQIACGPCPTCKINVSERQLYPAFYNYNEDASCSTSASNSLTNLDPTESSEGIPNEAAPACVGQCSEPSSEGELQEPIIEVWAKQSPKELGSSDNNSDDSKQADVSNHSDDEECDAKDANSDSKQSDKKDANSDLEQSK